MVPSADCYLPGVVRCGAGDPTLVRESGERIPLADPEGRLSPELDGERCTVGVDVAVAAVAGSETVDAGLRETARTNLVFRTNRKCYDALDRIGGETPVTETW